ncbi:MAG: HD domain-containing protein [Gemmataceae bacterium]
MNHKDPFLRILAAIAFSARHHLGQIRKDNKTPYVSHPFRVTFILRDLFEVADHDTLTACVLHDTLEDTLADFDDLEEEFGHKIAEWVAMLSKDPRLPEEKREALYCDVLAKAPWQVQVCKLADVYDNLLDSTTFDPKKRLKAIKKKRQYMDAIATGLKPEAKKALLQTLKVYDELIENCQKQAE